MEFARVYSKKKFDSIMEKNGWNDMNIPVDSAFISICCTKEIKENYLKKVKHREDGHWFKRNHPNVLNVEFDDILDKELKTDYGMAYGISGYTAKEILKFIYDNEDKENFYIHCMAGRSRSIAVGKFLADYFNARLYCQFGVGGINQFVYNKLKENL